jgi:hypothetical protein
MTERRFYVYIFSNPLEGGRAFYIGKGQGNRWREHFREVFKGTHHNKYFQRIVLKIFAAGREPGVEKTRLMTETEALQLERTFIAEIGRHANEGPLVNMTDGGEGVSGYVMGLGHRAALLASIKGKPLSVEHRAKIGDGNRRRVWTPEMRMAASKGRPKRRRATE